MHFSPHFSHRILFEFGDHSKKGTIKIEKEGAMYTELLVTACGLFKVEPEAAFLKSSDAQFGSLVDIEDDEMVPGGSTVQLVIKKSSPNVDVYHVFYLELFATMMAALETRLICKIQ